MKLDAKTVATLPLPADAGRSEVFYWDDQETGMKGSFGLRWRSNGKSQWIVQYRTKVEKTQRRCTIGAAVAIDPDKARRKAIEILTRVENGEDPSGEDRKTREDAKRKKLERTCRDHINTFIAEKQRALRPATMKALRLFLLGPKKHPYFERLHSMQLTEITKPLIAECMSRIKRNSLSMARQAHAHLGSFLSWATGECLIDQNPIIGLKAPKPSLPDDRVLKDHEIVAIWRAADAVEGDFGRIIKLLLVLGCRRQEIGSLRWDEVDLEKKLLSLPASKTKGKRPLILPLPPLAVEILKNTPRHRDWVFGSHRRKQREVGFIDWSASKKAFDKRLGDQVKEPWRPHSLRKTVATRMGDLGIEPHIVDLCLGHAGHRAGISGIYNYSAYKRPMTAALSQWARHLSDIVEGRSSAEEKIIPFPA
jgi:integrase